MTRARTSLGAVAVVVGVSSWWWAVSVAAQPDPLAEPEPAPAAAQPEPAAAPAPQPVPEPGPEPAPEEEEYEDPGSDRLFDTRIYGFIDGYWERVHGEPSGVSASGETETSDPASEFDVANLHLMVQGSILGRYRYFLNLTAPGSGSTIEDGAIAVRNAWVEAPIIGDHLRLRLGKTYRRFGLYNEILDAVPTFIGIEQPEMLDKDHVMVTRTTNLMLHGSLALGDNTLVYAVMTGNDEREAEQLPLGLDVHFDLGTLLRVGVSGYSTLGRAAPGRGPGDGSPRGGVVNWMDEDEYWVIDAYAQLTIEGLTLQVEYARAQHDAVRNADSVIGFLDTDADGMFDPGGVMTTQRASRFYTGDLSMMLDPANVPTAVEYTINTFYLRAGYELELGDAGSLIPYAQVDYYSNPEIIVEKDFGGDGEAGLADDGSFLKLTLGAIYLPIPQVALKIDVSDHVQEFNGESLHYFDVRVSLSYQWELEL